MNEPATPDSSIAVVLPTYNEAANVEPLIAEILVQTRSWNLCVIVVDDNSPDGTGDIVKSLMQKHNQADRRQVELLEREGKLGLGTAYVAGFHRAMEMGADWVFTMDADFSHDPRHIPEMLERTDGADLVIGSRYVSGGGVQNWPWFRRWLSAGANVMARLVLRLDSRDCTSGYRCYRVAFLQNIALEEIRSDGYSFLIDLLYRLQNAGARIVASPIVFTDRRGGESKISKTEIFKAIKTLWTLYFS